MERKVVIAYRVLVISLLILLGYSAIKTRIDIVQPGWQSGYTEIDNYSHQEVKAERSDEMTKNQYRFTLQGIESDKDYLYVYSIHQTVKVYLDQKCVYDLEKAKGRLNWESPGCVWNEVPVFAEDNGKKVTIEFTPVYKDVAGVAPIIYVGTKYDVVRHLIDKDFVAIVMGLLACLLGFFIFLFGWLQKEQGKNSMVRNMVATFAVIVGLWKISVTVVMGLPALKYPVLSMGHFWLLMLLPIPYVYSIKTVLKENNKLFIIPCIVSMANIIAVTSLQCTRIADLKETLWMTHFSLIFCAVFCMGIVGYYMVKKGFSKESKYTLLGAVCCFAWLLTELLTYFFSDTMYTSSFGMLFFFVYLVLLGSQSANDLRALLKFGMEARQYEKIAYFDQLTGLYNRMALAEYENNEDFKPENFTVAVFDINNLKKYNDSFGHDKGDWYIKECAQVIRMCFGDIGLCYRTGGDEFMALLQDVKEGKVKQRMKDLEGKVKNFNMESNDLVMGIAYGYASYDSAMDKDIEDVSKRADQMMYMCKYEMKHKGENVSAK